MTLRRLLVAALCFGAAGCDDTSPAVDAATSPAIDDGVEPPPRTDGGQIGDLGVAPDMADLLDAATPADGAPPPLDARVVPPGDARVEVPDAAVPVDAAPPPDDEPLTPLITEVMARGGSDYEDEDGDTPDWVELYNPGATPYELRGHHLTDDLETPDKWRFPAVTLAPHAYLVVFASGKDRRAADGELHTGFRLSGDGETVALTDRQGEVVHAVEDFPAQVQGVAYGLPMEIGRTPLMEPGGPARLWVGQTPPGAANPELDDSRWREVTQGVGFDRRPPPRAEVLQTDSQAAWSAAQGRGGWTYGAWDAAPGGYDADGFEAFDDLAWDGERWSDGARLDASGGRPTTDRWAVRRWVATDAAALRVSGRLVNPAQAGDGVVGRIFLDGEQVFARSVDGRALDYRVDVEVVPGSRLDFVLDPLADDGADDSVFTARIALPPVGLDALGPALADTHDDWSADGSQGAVGWRYGHYTDGAFVPFADDAWTGLAWQGDATVERDEARSAEGAWAARRWESTTDGAVLARVRVAKVDPAGGGVTALVFHDGVEVARLAIAGDDRAGATVEVVLADLTEGDTVDFVLSTEGADGAADEEGDAVEFHASVRGITRFSDLVDTDIGPLLGLADAFWLRVPFTLPPGTETAVLELAYDDGVVAWVDGDQVHADNAGPGAAADRADSLAVGRVRIPLAGLEPGPHLLAINAVNAAADDGVFFVQAAVAGVGLVIHDRPGYLAVPTPGQPNIFGPVDRPPFILDVDRHQPVGVGDDIPVAAQVLPFRSPVTDVTLTYRVMFGPEIRLPMASVGDVWGAIIPADVAGPGQMVRWYVEATDADGRTARYPPFLDPLDSEEYVGTMVATPPIETNLPVYHWFVENPGGANTDAGARGALFHLGELYDNIRVDLHGQATRSFPKKSYNFDFNRDHRFRVREDLERVKDFDLLTNYQDKAKMRTNLAYGMFRDADHEYHLAFPVRLHQNGEFFAVYDFVEDPDERWLRRLGFEEPLGAVYKVYDNLSRADRSEKKTREFEGSADLAGLIAGLGVGGDARRTFIYDNVDLPRMANFLAMLFLTAGMDCCSKNYYAYHDLHTDRWWYLPWDIDLSLGRNWTGNYFDDRMFPRNPLFRGAGNRLITPLYELPEFVEMYTRRIRTLADEQMQPRGTPYEARYLEAEADRVLALIGADAVLDNERWGMWGIPQTMEEAVTLMKEGFLDPRRDFIYGELAAQPGGPVRTLLDGRPGATIARFLVPTDDALGAAWTAPGFDDDAWAEGPLGIGYENDAGAYAPLIRSVVRPAQANPAATSVLVRVRFDVDDPVAQSLKLRMRYDDGYVAWLNGVEVARRNVAPGPLSWQARAAIHDDGAAVRFENVDIQRFAGALVRGENVLAIRLVNTTPDSSDLLLQPEVVDGEPPGDGVLPPEQAAEVRVTIEAVEASPDAPLEAYVTLFNEEATAVDISGWRLSGRGIEHVFTGGTVLPAGARLYAAANVPGFRGRAEGPSGGQGLLVVGNWTGVMAEGGELALEPPEGDGL